MKTRLLKIIAIQMTVFIHFTCFGQVDNQDSLYINLLKAYRITDSINTPLPDSIRQVTIRDMKKYGFNPSEYFTIYDLRLDKTNNLGEFKGYIIRSREDFKCLDNSDISKDSWIIAYSKNIKKIENSWIVEYYRIGALRDRCLYTEKDRQGFETIGSWGDAGDDILVYYNYNFSAITKISEAE